MTNFRTIDEEKLKSSSLRTFLYINLTQSDDSLLNTAMVGLSAVFGNHPDSLNSDNEYYNFVSEYLKKLIIPYTQKAAAQQLALLTFGGHGTMQSAYNCFIKEAMKVKEVIFPNKVLSDIVFEEENRSWHLFMTILTIIALLSHKEKSIAKMYGIKKTFFGDWKIMN
jgi:hypothetical protein